ncbi:MAG: hypothetical protein JWO37_3826 [Acidimicrobiales bacterium]|jgi:hypothetical protein|nr:hypothetical protein [Acidimicrobiales bacterium]
MIDTEPAITDLEPDSPRRPRHSRFVGMAVVLTLVVASVVAWRARSDVTTRKVRGIAGVAPTTSAPGGPTVAAVSGPFTDDVAPPDPAGDWPGGLAHATFQDPFSGPSFNDDSNNGLLAVVPCPALLAATQGLLGHLAATPPGTRPFCSVSGNTPAGLADALIHDNPPSGQWTFTMAYVPVQLDLRAPGSFVARGAIQISGDFGLPAPQWPTRPYNPRPASGRGGMEPISVHGHFGTVARTAPTVINLVWAEPLPAGGWVRWNITGNQDVLPSQLLHDAETLQPGPPPDELVPPTYIPPR